MAAKSHVHVGGQFILRQWCLVMVDGYGGRLWSHWRCKKRGEWGGVRERESESERERKRETDRERKREREREKDL